MNIGITAYETGDECWMCQNLHFKWLENVEYNGRVFKMLVGFNLAITTMIAKLFHRQIFQV